MGVYVNLSKSPFFTWYTTIFKKMFRTNILPAVKCDFNKITDVELL